MADQIDDPARFAIRIRTGQLDAVLAPLASDVTTTIIGFTELGEDGFLYKAAAVFHRGTVAQAAELTSHGSSAIVNPKGTVVRSAVALSEDVLAAAIEVTPRIAVGDKTPN